MKIFNRKDKLVTLPAVLMAQEDPVNYNSVLDWLLGLSDKDYKVMLEVVEVYRSANKTSAKLLKVKDAPTTTLATLKPTDEEIDQALDDSLNGNVPFIDPSDDEEPTPPIKPQAGSKKVEIK